MVKSDEFNFLKVETLFFKKKVKTLLNQRKHITFAFLNKFSKGTY